MPTARVRLPLDAEETVADSFDLDTAKFFVDALRNVERNTGLFVR